jgi:acyl-coenzyme A thioesterase PaaI-like protein
VTVVDGVAIGTCTLGLQYEGPAGHVHGGISALLLDQVLGKANAANGRPGMTISLSIRYRKRVPLWTPLRITAWLEDPDGQAVGKAEIAAADAPETPLVVAEGRFVGVKLR